MENMETKNPESAEKERSKVFTYGNGLLENLQHEASLKPLETGIKEIDKLFGLDLQPGTLAFLCGESSTGKTTFLNQITDHIAKGRPVIYVSLENTAQNLGEKSLIRITNQLKPTKEKPYKPVSGADLKKYPDLTEGQLLACQEAEKELKELQKVVLDNRGLNPITGKNEPVSTTKAIEESVKQLKKEVGVSPVVVVDNFNSLLDDRFSGVALDKANCQHLKRIANEQSAVVITVAPISKSEIARVKADPENEHLTKESIKDTVETTYLADLIVGMINLEEDRRKAINEIRFEVMKARNGEAHKEQVLKFHKKTQTFKK